MPIYVSALEAVSADLHETLSQVGRPDTQWLSVQAIAASLATSQLKHCSSNIDVKNFAELCTYRRTKIQELVENEVMDSQPINAMELYFLEHNCAVTYTLDLPTLFGHASSEYFIIRKLEKYSVDQDRASDEQLISLPLREKRGFVHEQDGYAYVTITLELQIIVRDVHPGWFAEMEVDDDDELVSFSVCDAHGRHTLAFRFLRRETVGRLQPKFTVGNVKPQPPSVDAKEVGKDGNKDVAEAVFGDGRKVDHYGNRILPPTNARPHLTAKIRMDDKTDDDRLKLNVGLAGEGDVKPNPYENLLLPAVKRKAESEGDGKNVPAKKK